MMRWMNAATTYGLCRGTQIGDAWEPRPETAHYRRENEEKEEAIVVRILIGLVRSPTGVHAV